MPPPADNRNRVLVSQTAAAFSARLLGAALSLAFTWVISQGLSADAAGQFFFAYSAVLLAVGLVKGGLAKLTMREVAVARDRRAMAHVVNRSSLLALAYAAIGALGLIALLRAGQAALPSDCVASLSAGTLVVTLAVTTVFAHALRGMGSIVKGILLDTAIFYALAVIAIVVLAPSNANEMLVLAAVCSAAASAVTFMVTRRYTRAAPNQPRIGQTPRAISSLRSHVQSSLVLMLSSAFGLVISWVPPLLIGAWHQPSEVAMIAVATRIALGVTLLVTTVEVVIGPSLSRLRSRESARERAALFWNAWRLLMLLTSPALVALFVFSREILGLFGAEYVQAGLALRLLLVGQFFVVCSGGAANVLVMTGRERLWTKMSGASAVFAIPLLGILGYHLSVEGVALAVMLTPTRAPGASPQAAIMAAARTIRTDHT